MLDTPMLPVTMQISPLNHVIPALAHAQPGVQAIGTPGQSGFADPVSGGVTAQPSPAPVTGTAAAPGAEAVPGGVTVQPLPPPSASRGGADSMSLLIWIIPIMLIVMIIFSSLAGRKEKKKKDEMISAIKKHDKVQMLGGIIGSVVEVGDDDIVIRVEEGRIRFAKTAIAAVIGSAKTSGTVEAKPDGKSDAKADAKSGAKANA